MIAMLAMAVAISLAIFASDTVSLTVTKDNASVDGKWDPITGQNPEVRNINVTAGAGVTLNKDGTVKNSDTTGCSVAISPNDEEHCNATCTLDPTAPYHKAHTTGHYSFGGGGEGSLPEWNAIATAPTVKITKCPDKMLVEGKFDVEADGQPKIEGEKYDWSFTGPGPKDTAFNPDPSADGKTKFTPDEITKTGQQSFVNVKYSGATDKKEAKITRCEYFKEFGESLEIPIKKIDANLYIAENPYPCSRSDGENQFLAFWAFFSYELYDQYRKSLTESEQGEAVPYVMEKFVRKPYSAFGKKPKITYDWVDEEDCKMTGVDDEDRIYVPYSFASLTNEDKVREGATAVSWDIDWLASVEEGLHEENTVRHWVFSRFIDVRRERNGDKKLISFRIKTHYFRTGAFIKK